MKLKYFRILGLVITTIALTSCKGKTEKEIKKTFSKVTTRPNIVFIMSDDHAYQAISAYGHHLNHTPNIDRIAGKVDNFHAFNWDQDNFVKSLQKVGYQTALVGKIHLDGKPQGFDYSNVLPGQGYYYNRDFIYYVVIKRIP